jgi:cell division protein FtsB
MQSEPTLEQQVKILLIDLVNALKSSNLKGEIILQQNGEIQKLKQTETELRAQIRALESRSVVKPIQS